MIKPLHCSRVLATSSPRTNLRKVLPRPHATLNKLPQHALIMSSRSEDGGPVRVGFRHKSTSNYHHSHYDRGRSSNDYTFSKNHRISTYYYERNHNRDSYGSGSANSYRPSSYNHERHSDSYNTTHSHISTDKFVRAAIARNTVSRSAQITTNTPHASATSTFIPSQLPFISELSPNHTLSPFCVITGNTIAATLALASKPGYATKTAILNMANETQLASGWNFRHGQTQEDALCYSSTLFSTLASHATSECPEGIYPWRSHGKPGSGNIQGVFSPGVVFFKHPVSKGARDLPEEERRVLSVISVAAPRLSREAVVYDSRNEKSEVADRRRMEELREKIKLIYRIAVREGKTVLVLGPMGCGSFNWPGEVVAREMRGILMGREFEGWFQEVVWVIYDERTARCFRRAIKD